MGKIYIGINDVAKQIKTPYIGVGGVAKKIKKIYLGVAGVAKLVWNAFNPVNPGFTELIRQDLGVGFHNLGTFLTRSRLLEAKANGYTTLNLELSAYVSSNLYRVGIATSPSGGFWDVYYFSPSSGGGYNTHNYQISIDVMLATNTDFYYMLEQRYANADWLNYYAKSYFS